MILLGSTAGLCASAAELELPGTPEEVGQAILQVSPDAVAPIIGDRPVFNALTPYAVVHLGVQRLCGMLQGNETPMQVSSGDCMARLYATLEQQGAGGITPFTATLERCRWFVDQHGRSDAAVACVETAAAGLLLDMIRPQ